LTKKLDLVRVNWVIVLMKELDLIAIKN